MTCKNNPDKGDHEGNPCRYCGEEVPENGYMLEAAKDCFAEESPFNKAFREHIDPEAKKYTVTFEVTVGYTVNDIEADSEAEAIEMVQENAYCGSYMTYSEDHRNYEAQLQEEEDDNN